jgi:hypothetical protein
MLGVRAHDDPAKVRGSSMEQTYERAWTSDTVVLARSAAMSAGDVGAAVRTELARLLAANGGDRRKALPSGFDELVGRNALSRSEATELAAIMDLLFDAPDGDDPKLGPRVRAYYGQLVLDPGASPAALAIASVITSLLPPTTVGTGEPALLAVTKGDVLSGSFGALVGAGIGAAFGPIGAGVGAVVGGAVGVCIARA